MQVSNILESIDLGAVALPEFQRGYVWTRKQVRDFLFSLYRKRPVGSLLFWVTPSLDAPARGDAELQPGHVKLILDGQQRITTLYGVIKGRPPAFFDGNPDAFEGLMFHLENESFEYYAPVKMRDDPYWVNVTELMSTGLDPFIARINTDPLLQPRLAKYIGRLNTIHSIRERDFHIEEVAGDGADLDEVVEVFNNLNRGGTKLSKGDLALAKMCAGWPEARGRMRKLVDTWASAGYLFSLDWLLRNVTTVITGQALFEGLENVKPAEFREGLLSAERLVNYTLNLISGRLGLDHDRVLAGRYAFPVISRYLARRGGKIRDAAERDRLLYWYIFSALWGRYTGSTESTLNSDLRAVEESPEGGEVGALIEQLRLWRGEPAIRPEDFRGWSLGSRFYPLLYLLTRVGESRDWESGIPLKADMLGRMSRLNVHHIFPKAVLYKADYSKTLVNSIANFCFQTQDTNLGISDMPPEKYFPKVEERCPGVLASQWIPMDESLWRVKKYEDFLAARRELLSQAANGFLMGLLETTSAPVEEVPTTLTPVPEPAVGGIESEEEDQILRSCREWAQSQGLSAGELSYELVSEEGTVLALLDLAWPDGVQTGLSVPVCLLINEGDDVEDLVNRSGYRYFTSVEAFRDYVATEILVQPVRV